MKKKKNLCEEKKIVAAYDVRASLLVPPCFFVTNSFRRSYLSNDLYESHRKSSMARRSVYCRYIPSPN